MLRDMQLIVFITDKWSFCPVFGESFNASFKESKRALVIYQGPYLGQIQRCASPASGIDNEIIDAIQLIIALQASKMYKHLYTYTLEIP